MSIDAIREAYRRGAGTWTGCDWPTSFGPRGLDLKDVSSARAAKLALEAADPDDAEQWRAASRWLANVELRAEQAEIQAALALAAANAGDLALALRHARQAHALEEVAGRPSHRPAASPWLPLCEAITSALASGARAAYPSLAVEQDLNVIKHRLDELGGRLRDLQREVESLESTLRSGVHVA